MLFIYSPVKKQEREKRQTMMCVSNICDLPSNICDLPSNICDLPSELIALIVDRLGNKDYLVAFKETCGLFNKSVSQFYIAGQMVSAKYGVFIPRYECVNIDCEKETEDVHTYVWNYGFRRYYHSHQVPLNQTTMVVDGKLHFVKSHYCCECFKKHVLIGSNQNVSQHYGDIYSDDGAQVNVLFTKKPSPSTWTNYRTKQVELLLEIQVNALNGKFE